MENCYEILGVQPNATAAEIRRAYRLKAKELHPDSTGSNESAGQFRLLVKAYEILSDARQRSLFDESYFYRKEAKKTGASLSRSLEIGNGRKKLLKKYGVGKKRRGTPTFSERK